MSEGSGQSLLSTDLNNAQTLTWGDLQRNMLLGQMTQSMKLGLTQQQKDYIQFLYEFVYWLGHTKKPYDKSLPITSALFNEYLRSRSQQPLVNGTTLGNVSKNVSKKIEEKGLKMLRGLFPSRVNYFQAKKELADSSDVDTMIEDMSEMAEDKAMREADLKMIANNYLELMNLLPDKSSREDAQKYINSLLESKDIPLEFKAQKGGEGNTVLLATIRKMLDLDPPAAPPNPTDPEYLRTVIQSTLLALLQGTGLQVKMEGVIPLLLDTIKTGVLASVAATSTSQQLAEKVAASAPDTSYQDAIARAALLSVLASLTTMEKQDAAAKKFEDAAAQIAENAAAVTHMNPETVDMISTAMQSSLYSMLMSLSKVEELEAKMEAHVASVTQQLQLASDNALTPEEINRVQELIAAKTTEAVPVPTIDELRNIVETAKDDLDKGVATKFDALFEQKLNAAIDDKLKALSEIVAKHDTDIKKLQSIPTKLEELDATFKSLIKLMEARGNAEETKGGKRSMGGDAQVDPVAQAKQFRKDLDQVKKNLRGITDAVKSITGRYTKFAEILAKIKPRGTSDATKPDDKAILGYYSYMKEDGKKLIDDIKQIVSEKKKVILESQQLLQTIFDADPTNPITISTGMTTKTLIEGNYEVDNEDKSGILSLMDQLYGMIKSEYDDHYSFIKSAAEGIKQQQDYDIRNKERYVMGALQGRGGSSGALVGGVGDLNPILNGLTTKVDKLMQDVVLKTDQMYARKLNPSMSAAVIGEPTMFMQLYNNYLENKMDKGQVVAARKLTEEMAANHLIPADVMKISAMDKTIFVFVTIVLRMVSLGITKYLIEKGNLRTLPWALGAFLFFYALIFIAFVMFVNLDMYRLRILFNYINFHGNMAGVFMHLGLMWLFSFVIFIVMWNLNFPLRGVQVTAISDQEKADLIYRLEVLTMIVWMFLVLMIIISQ